jgi:hypothetical protein
MTTIVFVHGIGVRQDSYHKTFTLIKQKLLDERPDLNLIPCCWGESLGARLNARGVSIPLYDTTRSTEYADDKDYEIALWERLYKDSLYELRVLSLKSGETIDFTPGQTNPGYELDERVHNLTPSPKLEPKLNEAGIAEVFDEAKQAVINSMPYNEALQTASEPLGEYHDAIARAIIAEAMALCERQDKYAIVLTDAVLRDEVVELLSSSLGDGERGIGDWFVKKLFGLAVAMRAMDHVQRQRGAITDAAYPFVGDVVLYQGRGEQIRQFIREHIVRAEPPVVLLTHSLGGIACVDLLVKAQLSQVHLLVTVGSQAPFLYEINALQSLQYGQPLPAHFPTWLNIYDLRDFLSYVGSGVFPEKIQDVLVDNKQPFPHSHCSYWTNPSTWRAIVPRLP